MATTEKNWLTDPKVAHIDHDIYAIARPRPLTSDINNRARNSLDAKR